MKPIDLEAVRRVDALLDRVRCGTRPPTLKEIETMTMKRTKKDKLYTGLTLPLELAERIDRWREYQEREQMTHYSRVGAIRRILHVFLTDFEQSKAKKAMLKQAETES